MLNLRGSSEVRLFVTDRFRHGDSARLVELKVLLDEDSVGEIENLVGFEICTSGETEVVEFLASATGSEVQFVGFW